MYATPMVAKSDCCKCPPSASSAASRGETTNHGWWRITLRILRTNWGCHRDISGSIRRHAYVLRWRIEDLSRTCPQPNADFTLKAKFDGCDRTYPSCSTALMASLLLAVSEEVAGLMVDGYHRKMIIYAIDWKTMSVRWAVVGIGIRCLACRVARHGRCSG